MSRKTWNWIQLQKLKAILHHAVFRNWNYSNSGGDERQHLQDSSVSNPSTVLTKFLPAARLPCAKLKRPLATRERGSGSMRYEMKVQKWTQMSLFFSTWEGRLRNDEAPIFYGPALLLLQNIFFLTSFWINRYLASWTPTVCNGHYPNPMFGAWRVFFYPPTAVILTVQRAYLQPPSTVRPPRRTTSF